ncbi:MAG: hypothetical protein GY717_14660 [Rhodobacteraceae bacterium]|nr:hypothetical protein [Paracoccaceae bacterium]
MSLLSRLFGGGGSAPEAEPVSHEGFRIFAEPVSEPGGYRICARIEKEIGGEMKTHQMIRADTYGSADAATEASVAKAKQVIDQMGEAVFG